MIFLLFLKIYEWNIRYGHKQQLSHEILLYIPLVDFFMAKRNPVFAILLLVWGKGKKWSHFYVQSS